MTFDLVVLLPLLWLWLGVRRGGAPAVSTVPVAVGGWLVAKALLPDAGEAWLDAAAGLAPVVEVGLLAYLGLRMRRVVRGYRRTVEVDPVLRMRAAVGRALGRNTATRLLADEVTTLRYLVRPPGTPPPDGTRAFTCHRRSGWGGMVFALCLAVGIEVVAVHALVARWSAGGAWVLTGLSLYGLLWLVADWRASRARPHLLDGDRLLVRAGLRWTASVPLATVRGVRRLPAGEDLRGEGELSTATPGASPVVLELSRPVTVDGPFGVSRQVTRLGLAVDDPDRLAEALGHSAR